MNFSFHFLLAYRVSFEKSDVNHAPLYRRTCLFLTALRILSLSLVLANFYYNVPQCCFIWIYFYWHLWASWSGHQSSSLRWASSKLSVIETTIFPLSSHSGIPMIRIYHSIFKNIFFKFSSTFLHFYYFFFYYSVHWFNFQLHSFCFWDLLLYSLASLLPLEWVISVFPSDALQLYRFSVWLFSFLRSLNIKRVVPHSSFSSFKLSFLDFCRHLLMQLNPSDLLLFLVLCCLFVRLSLGLSWLDSGASRSVEIPCDSTFAIDKMEHWPLMCPGASPVVDLPS